jgi:hypothetical protein
MDPCVSSVVCVFCQVLVVQGFAGCGSPQNETVSVSQLMSCSRSENKTVSVRHLYYVVEVTV